MSTPPVLTPPTGEPPVRHPRTSKEHAKLEQAFQLFVETSRHLEQEYAALQQRADTMAQQLEIANGALRQQFEEKDALSRRLATLLDALPGGVVELDVAGRVMATNPAARTILGSDLLGVDWQQVESLLKPSDTEGEWIFRPSAESPYGQAPPASAAIREAQRLTIVENHLPSGERILLLHDVSESGRLRQQLAQHRQLAAMGEMAAGLAHQLRTPLATALLYAANLAAPQIGEAERLRFSERLLKRLRHLENLVQNMLQFVRGQQQMLESCDLVALCTEVFQMLQAQVPARNWQIETPSEALLVLANPRELTGALINLLENATQATTVGATIALTLHSTGEQGTIIVRDEGRGMPEAVQARLFEPFFTTRKEGTGLGLAIVRNLVTAYAGRIEVHSQPGAGSQFRIELPLLQPTHP